MSAFWILILVPTLAIALNYNISLQLSRSFQFFVPSSSVFQLSIKPSQFQFLLVQIDSCRLGLVKVNTSQEPLTPVNQYQFSDVYNIGGNQTKLIVNYTNTSLNSYLTIFGFNDYSNLPSNSRDISAEWEEENLQLSFEPINIYGNVVQCNYTIQFQTYPLEYNCRFNDTNHAVGQINIPSAISNNLTNFTIAVPLYGPKTTTTLEIYNRLDKIQQLLDSGVPFQVNVYARITKPMVIDISYKKVLVQPMKTLQTLKTGFIIIVIGAVVYGIVSCGYLYFKRKYKNPHYLHQQPDPYPHQQDNQNHPSSGTVEQLQKQN